MAESVKSTLDALFTAERTARTLHGDLLTLAPKDLVAALRTATKEALGVHEDDSAEGSLRLARIAVLLGDLEGDDVVDLLIDILGGPSPEARGQAADSLEGLAFDRFKEVALGIERALERLPKGSTALTELPFLLAEVGEPGCVKLLGRFLKHADGEAVAAAIEAIAELGDPAAIPLLAPLEKDARQVQLDDSEGGESERVSIGDLAYEAREILEELAESMQQASHGPPKQNRGGPPPQKNNARDPRGKKGR